MSMYYFYNNLKNKNIFKFFDCFRYPESTPHTTVVQVLYNLSLQIIFFQFPLEKLFSNHDHLPSGP